MANVRRHLEIVAQFGLPCVVAVNRRPGDTDEECRARRADSRSRPARSGPRSTRASRTAAPASATLAEAVVEACEQPNDFRSLYEDGDPIAEKIETRRQARLRRRRGVFLHPRPKRDRRVQKAGLGPPAGLHGQDAPVAVSRPDAARTRRDFTLPGPRPPRLHRRRLARAAVRRHPADARARRDAGRAATSTSTPRAAPSACSEPGSSHVDDGALQR